MYMSHTECNPRIIPDLSASSTTHMEAGAKREAMASSLGSEADQEHNGSGYTIAATAHAVDTGTHDQQDLFLTCSLSSNCMNLYQHGNLH